MVGVGPRTRRRGDDDGLARCDDVGLRVAVEVDAVARPRRESVVAGSPRVTALGGADGDGMGVAGRGAELVGRLLAAVAGGDHDHETEVPQALHGGVDEVGGHGGRAQGDVDDLDVVLVGVRRDPLQTQQQPDEVGDAALARDLDRDHVRPGRHTRGRAGRQRGDGRAVAVAVHRVAVPRQVDATHDTAGELVDLADAGVEHRDADAGPVDPLLPQLVGPQRGRALVVRRVPGPAVLGAVQSDRRVLGDRHAGSVRQPLAGLGGDLGDRHADQRQATEHAAADVLHGRGHVVGRAGQQDHPVLGRRGDARSIEHGTVRAGCRQRRGEQDQDGEDRREEARSCPCRRHGVPPEVITPPVGSGEDRLDRSRKGG